MHKNISKKNTTIICAVWSKDPNRHELLKQHQENLLSQTIPVEIVYIFDSGDSPPADLRGEKIISSRDISIYEAWNFGITAVRTDFVMNLNLDDRLNFDAVEILQQGIEEEQAWLIGGDWKICYSQKETNCVGNSYLAKDLPFLTDWPPASGSKTRLGSGTGERGTYGPATLWRLACHLGAPRYPFRTADGVLIKSIADSIWWTTISNHLNKKMFRLPRVIGNYHSHPSDQAEFRLADETISLQGKRISLI
jgi:hypothetical protein